VGNAYTLGATTEASMSTSRAVLVGIQTRNQSESELSASLDELERLCDTLGFTVVGRLTQKLSSQNKRRVLGDGKLKELAKWTGGPGWIYRGPQLTKKKHDERFGNQELPTEPGEDTEPKADVVVVDAEMSPSQLRNLQTITGVEVLDRAGVILEIFSRNARSKEAKTQVEIARLVYMAPRLRETGGTSERAQGGIGGKGRGESNLELDRRKVRDRIAELREELELIETKRGHRRARRRAARQIALVGYTNAGKSSLMRQITGADPYVADKLFATLDTQVRKLDAQIMPPVLVTDTVGFIRDLPHDLVASFRSTLDAALEASFILHVVDASDPSFRDHITVTTDVLKDIEAEDIPRVLVLNKCDVLNAEDEAALAEEFPESWRTSAKTPERIQALIVDIVDWFAQQLIEAKILIPWAKAGVMGTIRGETEVLDESFEDDGIRYTLRGSKASLARVAQALKAM
jgi:GTP-binding protein HflX